MEESDAVPSDWYEVRRGVWDHALFQQMLSEGHVGEAVQYIDGAVLRLDAVYEKFMDYLSSTESDQEEVMRHAQDMMIQVQRVYNARMRQLVAERARLRAVERAREREMLELELRERKELELRKRKELELRERKELELRERKELELRERKELELRERKELELDEWLADLDLDGSGEGVETPRERWTWRGYERVPSGAGWEDDEAGGAPCCPGSCRVSARVHGLGRQGRIG